MTAMKNSAVVDYILNAAASLSNAAFDLKPIYSRIVFQFCHYTDYSEAVFKVINDSRIVERIDFKRNVVTTPTSEVTKFFFHDVEVALLWTVEHDN